MSAILYARVSTDRQEAEGTSLEAQVAALEAAAAKDGLGVKSRHAGSESGKLEMAARPCLMAALADVGPGDVLYVTTVDRLSRSVFVAEGVVRAVRGLGARVRILEVGGRDDDPQTVFMRQVLAAVAELERANIVARTMAGKMRSVAKGGRWGGVEFGMRPAKGGGLEPDDAEQETMRAVRAALEAGQNWRQVRESTPGRKPGTKVSFQVISKVAKMMKEEAHAEE